MKHRLLTTLTAALLALTSWSNGVEIDGINYELDSSKKTASVTYTGNLYVDGSNSYNPSSTAYKGSITIPNSVTYDGTTYSVTSIGIGAFYNCKGLMLVEIPNSVTSIGNIAFYLCTGLMNIIIPNSVTKIGKNAFKYCSSITSITIPSSVNIIEEGTFYECTRLTSIEIPNSVTSIGNYAFKGCSNLTSITIPNSVTSIKEEAFYGCSRLKSIEIPNSVSNIGSRAFEGCSSLKNIEIPNSVTSIGIQAFYGCTSLTSIEIPPSITSIKDYMFSQCSGLASIEIPNSVTTIGKSVFHSCSSLTNITIPSSVSSIGSHAFYGCTNLTSITIPSSVISIEEATFYECTCLTSIEIPNSVTSIGHNAFRGCIGLKSIEIPNSVKVIGNTAFCNCTNLEYINARRSDPKAYNCSNSAFYSVPYSTCTLYVPSGSEEAYANTAPWSNFVNIVDDIDTGSDDTVVLTADGEEVWTDGVLRFSVSSEENGEAAVSGVKDKDNLGAVTIPEKVKIADKVYSVTGIGERAFYECKGLTSINIPESVTSIGERAFAFCTDLTSINIPNSVSTIGDYTFWNSQGLTSVTIGNSVTSIGFGAFLGCYGLTSIDIPESVTSIGELAFGGCPSLTSIKVEAGNTTFDSREGCNAIIQTKYNRLIAGCQTTTIPSSVNTIGSWAFADCTGLTSITIPNSVTSIEYHAFDGCTGLTSISIPESVTWIGNYVFSDCTSLTSIKVEAGNMTFDSRESCNAIIETESNRLVAGCQATTIPSSVTFIWDGAFAYCRGLTSITIPESVAIIGIDAFNYCYGLTSITIPNSVTSIEERAFNYCYGLTSINIPESVTSIGESAFRGCTGLKDVYALRTDPADYNCATDAFSDYSATLHVPAGSKEAYAGTAPWSNFASIVDDIDTGSDDAVVLTADGKDVWTDGVLRFSVSSEENGEAAVSGVKVNVIPTTATIPEKVKIADKVYSVTSIGEWAFSGCTSLTSVEIPNFVTTIGDYAFHGCTGLTSITIPNSVTSIGIGAFYDCSGLTSITIPESVTSIGIGAFGRCSGLTSIEVEAGNTQYDSREACNAIIETESNTLIAGCMNTIIPNSVTSIGNYTFYGCTGLTSINIPNSVTSIGDYAFASCIGLTSVTIPESVTSIGNQVFEGCSGLTSITIPESVTSIGIGAFYDCSGLTSITIPEFVTSIGNYAFAGCSGLTSIEIPNSVTSIGDYAFDGCTNLTDVYTGNSVTTIGDRAFSGCKGLTSITIPSSVTSIGEKAFQYCTSLKYINALRTDPAAYNCDKSAFSNVPTSTCTLYVLSGSKEAYKAIEPWSNFTNIEEEPIQVGGLLYTIQGNEATCVGPGSVEGWFNNPVENIPERITFDGKEYIVTAVEGVSYDGSIIVLPKTLKRIGSLSAQNNVIICLSPTPPEIESTSVSRCALYVPDEYLEAHRKGWVIDGKLFGNRYSSLDVEAYPNLIPYYIRPMSHLLNYVYDDETMTATVNGFRLVTSNGTFTISEALGCTSSRMSSNYRERIWAEQNDINLDWVVPATITKFQYIYAGTQTRVKTGETYAVKKVAKLLGARSVTLSEGIEEVGQSAFSLDLWPVVTDAEGNAQYYNDPLESVSLPSTLKLLDRSAFTGCTSLKHVEMKEGLDSIGMSAFTYCLSLEDCHLPASLRAMGIGHGNLYSLQAFSTAQGSENIVAKDGVLFSDGGKTLLQYPAGKPDTTYEVPEGTVKLSEWSFEAVQELESIILPASVEEIGTWIFANTHCLKHIYCKSQTPPDKIGGWWLKASAPIRPDDAVLSSYDIYNEVTVHVPTGCKEIYANTIGWKGFNIVEEEDLTAIQSLTLSPSEAGESYYNLQGQRIAEPQRGQLVVVRRADGTSRKMYVR